MTKAQLLAALLLVGGCAARPSTHLAASAANACQQSGITDTSVCNDSAATVTARTFSAAGNATLGSANEFGASDQATTATTNSAASYEKISHYCAMLHTDASYYGVPSNILRDLVCREAHIYIAPGNQTGRVWAYHGTSGSLAGGDGYAVGSEQESVNNGTDAPDPNNTAHGYYGYHAIADGPQPSTAGYDCLSQGGWWHTCMHVPSGAAASALWLGNGVPIIADLPNGQQVDVGYVANGYLVLGGPGLNGTYLWTKNGYVLQ